MVRIRVVLASQSAAVRDALVEVIEAEADLTVVAAVTAGEELAAAVARAEPDIAVLDVPAPLAGGAELCRRVLSARPGTACLLLYAYADRPAIAAALRAGAAGWVLKQIRGNQLLAAIRALAEDRGGLADLGAPEADPSALGLGAPGPGGPVAGPASSGAVC